MCLSTLQSSNQPSTILTVDISGEKFVSEERRLRLTSFFLRRMEHVFLSLFTMVNRSPLGSASSPVSVGRSSSGMFRIFHKLFVSCRHPEPSTKLLLNYMLRLSVLECIKCFGFQTQSRWAFITNSLGTRTSLSFSRVCVSHRLEECKPSSPQSFVDLLHRSGQEHGSLAPRNVLVSRLGCWVICCGCSTWKSFSFESWVVVHRIITWSYAVEQTLQPTTCAVVTVWSAQKVLWFICYICIYKYMVIHNYILFWLYKNAMTYISELQASPKLPQHLVIKNLRWRRMEKWAWWSMAL